MPRRRVVFLDRDGTLIHDRPGYYLKRPEQVRIYPFAFQALRRGPGGRRQSPCPVPLFRVIPGAGMRRRRRRARDRLGWMSWRTRA